MISHTSDSKIRKLPILFISISLMLVSSASFSSNPSHGINDTKVEHASREVSLTDYPENWTEDIRLTFAEDHAVTAEVGAFGPYVHVVWEDRRDGVDRIFYKKSNDWGETWEDGLGHKDIDRRLSFRDCGRRPKISVDGFKIHVIWFDVINGTGSGALCSGTAFGVYYSHSYDNGATWSEPIIVSGNDSLVAAPSDILAHDDSVYVVWWDHKYNYTGKPTESRDQLYFRRSLDGGLTWEDEQRLTSTPRHSQGGRLVLDTRNNILHLVYIEGYYKSEHEIYYMQSRDNGETWEDGLGNPLSPRNLSNDTTMSGPTSIALTNKAIHVVWRDESWSGGLAYYTIYYIRSEDNGVTWSDRTVLVDNGGRPGRDPITLEGFLADKPELFARGDELYMFWFDTRDDNFTGEIYFKYSPDAGLNWTEDERLTFSENAWSAWPKAALFNQFIHLVWFDERHGYRIYEIYYKRYPKFFEDTMPPEIIHSPVATVEVGKDISISAQILDDFWIGNVTLNYRNVEGEEGNASMHLIGGDYSNGSWEYRIPAQNHTGILSYFIQASDVYGHSNQTSQYNISIIDSQGPSIEHFPPSIAYTNESTKLEANISDNLKVESVFLRYTDTIGTEHNLSMNLVAGDQRSGTWMQEIPPQWKPGMVLYAIIANDTSGNWNLTEAQFQAMDATPPVIGDVRIEPNPPEVKEPVNISFEVIENDLVEGVWIEVIDPEGIELGNQSARFDASTGRYFLLEEYAKLGNHTFHITVMDAKNNSNSIAGVFEVVDSTPPAIGDVSITPSIGEIYEEIRISATIADNYEVKEVWIKIQDSEGFSSNSSMQRESGDIFSFKTAFGNLGYYSFTILAKDSSNNWNSSSGGFLVVDSKPPQITNVISLPNPQEVLKEVSIIATVSENHRLESVTIRITDPNGNELNESMKQLTEDTYLFASSFSYLGAYHYEIIAADESGNQDVSIGSFTIQDWTPPIADAGHDITALRGSLVHFNGSSSWDNVGIENYTWSLIDKGTSIHLYGPNPSHRFLTTGEHRVLLTVRDSYGNEGTDEIVVLVVKETAPSQLALLWLLPIILIAVFLLVILLLRKRGGKQGNNER